MNTHQLLAQVTDVQTFWSGFDGEQRFVLAIVGIVCGTTAVLFLTGIIAGVFYTIRAKQIDVDLKRDMLDRGMTADEIDKVLSGQYSHWWGGWYYKK